MQRVAEQLDPDRCGVHDTPRVVPAAVEVDVEVARLDAVLHAWLVRGTVIAR
jgi:hypothetical protein